MNCHSSRALFASYFPPVAAALVSAGLLLNLPACQAAGAEARTRVDPKDGAEMVYVPAGEFVMGSKDGVGADDEHPQHTVDLDAYWIYKNDVTVAQYRKFCDATGRQMPQAPAWVWKDDYPIVNVSWEDARAYCEWAGAALPTEAQWEKAARGTDGRAYPWGNDWDKTKANSDESRLNAPTGVGTYPGGASPYGCLDMAGNVWQWCADWYDPKCYSNSVTRNPAGPTGGSRRVLRGGAWNFVPDFCRSALRNSDNPTYWLDTYGFRCVVGAGPN